MNNLHKRIKETKERKFEILDKIVYFISDNKSFK
jgi:hypothetical protein